MRGRGTSSNRNQDVDRDFDSESDDDLLSDADYGNGKFKTDGTRKRSKDYVYPTVPQIGVQSARHKFSAVARKLKVSSATDAKEKMHAKKNKRRLHYDCAVCDAQHEIIMHTEAKLKN